MRKSIEERMERQIVKTRKYNGMFDAAVTATEVATSASAVESMDNQYTVSANNLTTFIMCTDNDYSTINVSIDYQTPTANTRVADLTINVDGVYEENYHSIPRAIRTDVFDIINEVIDEVTEFIENFDPNAVTDLSEE